MEVFVSGNIFHKNDSVPLRMINDLREEFVNIDFKEFDAAEDLEFKGKNLVIIDTVKGIEEICVTEGIENFENSPTYTLHDFDLGFSLKLLRKLGKLEKIIIIGIPDNIEKRSALNGVKRVLYKLSGEVKKITINGCEYEIIKTTSKNRNARACLKGKDIVIKLPNCWSDATRKKISAELEKKAILSIEKGRWRGTEIEPINFKENEEFNLMGRTYMIKSKQRNRNSCCLIGNTFLVSSKDGNRISGLVKKEIIKSILPEIEKKVNLFNVNYFHTEIKKISLRDNVSRWGSWHNGRIMLNLRLLFGPSEVLDYVIVHELAHSKVNKHNKRFWIVVGNAMPDYTIRRKWLKANGHLLKPGAHGTF